MRPNHWEYLASVLFAIGFALALSGSIIYADYQYHPLMKPQYGGYPIPMLMIGTSTILIGTLAVWRTRTKKTEETEAEGVLPPPPPPPPPP